MKNIKKIFLFFVLANNFSLFAGTQVTTLIDATNMEAEGFIITGDSPSLSDNTFTFPESGHYCVKKEFFDDYKAGDIVSFELDATEAENNDLNLHIQYWANGQYDGMGGAKGEGSVEDELSFDATKLTVMFCRYNNKSFDPFDINKFTAIRTSAEPEPEEEIIAVYPGCREFSQGSETSELIVDDSQPKSLKDLFKDGTIQPGMTVRLRRKESSLVLMDIAQLQSSDAPFVHIVGEEDAGIEVIALVNVKNLRFSNLKIGNEVDDGYFVGTYETENLIFDNNFISAGDDYQSWDAQKWQDIGSGIEFRRSKCSSAYKNELKNLRFGLQAYVREDDGNPEILSQKTLFKDNFLQNISADFFRAIGSDVTIDGNIGLDHYVNEEDGDGNHDDFIQGFSYPIGVALDNVKILNNFYQTTTDPNRAYLSYGQGVGIFDGLYTNFEITNNTIISNHYHGITVFWGENGLIKNNTTTVMDSATERYMWIQSEVDKTGKYPPVNVKVINNVSNYLSLHENTQQLAENNIIVSVTDAPDNFVLFDSIELEFDVEVKKDSPFYVEGTGSTTTSIEKTQK